MSDKYVLDEQGNPVIESDVIAWARAYETQAEARIVGQTMVGEDVKVSTVFLGLDHSFGVRGGPVLWETMVFGGLLDGEQNRYRTRQEAEAGHAEMLARVRAAV